MILEARDRGRHAFGQLMRVQFIILEVVPLL